jgi:hypothetical protein
VSLERLVQIASLNALYQQAVGWSGKATTVAALIGLLELVTAAYTGSNLKPLPQRAMWPEDGDGKWAVQTKVEVSHKSPKSLRRDSPACSEL